VRARDPEQCSRPGRAEHGDRHTIEAVENHGRFLPFFGERETDPRRFRDFSAPRTRMRWMPDRSEEAFRRHHAQLFRYIRRRTPDDFEAEDVTQSVFLDAAQRLGDFKPGASPVLAWLYTVAQRRLADRARRLAHQHASLRELEQMRFAPAEPVYGTEVAAALREAIAALPETQRTVVVMKLLRGLSFAEVADRVGTSEAACKMRFARGLEALRDRLGDLL
jgi:RNA polymerase sigma-70 factor, ECF subfamily